MKEFFFKNKILKTMAIIFAIALWILVEGEKKTEVGFLIPLDFRNLPKDMVIIDKPVKEVEVRILASKKAISKLSPAQLSASVDLSMAKQGVNNFIIASSDIKIPMGAEIIKTNPSSILIHLETVVSKLVPVKVKLSGSPAGGFHIKYISIEPDSVVLFGAQSELNDINEIYTEPVEITGIRANKTTMLHIQLADTELKKAEPDVIKVKVSIARIQRGK